MIRIIVICLLMASPVMAYDSGPHTPVDIGGNLDTMDEPGAGPGVYGDLEGYKRVLALEGALDSMTPGTHPRLFLTGELISELVARERANTEYWQAVKVRADANTANIQDNAIVALVCANDNKNYPSGWSDPTVQSYVDRVIEGIRSSSGSIWPDHQIIQAVAYRNVAVWALGLDWVYDGLNQAERDEIVDKIANHINYQTAYAFWDDRNNEAGIRRETFHREGWAFYSWQQWPEVVIAGHNTTANRNIGDDALTFAKRRWSYDTYYGDALRWMVYQNDGQPMEGYQHGTVAIGWFIPLATAFGIDHWEMYMEAAAEQSLYELDLSPDANKMVFHYGISGDVAGIYSLDTDASNPWRQRDYIMRGASYFNDNPHNQWLLENVLQFGTNTGSVTWLFSQEYYFRWEEFEPIADLIWYDVSKPDSALNDAGYDELPTGKVWGTHRAVSRTGWGDDETIFELRARSATTRSSHTSFEAGSFQVYRDGNLSADSGYYGAMYATNIASYTGSTLSTNGLLLVDPENPGHPLTMVSLSQNFGGTDGASFRTFGFDYAIGQVKADVSGTVVAHSSYSDEARIVGSRTNELWDWYAADATVAYKNRATEFTRQATVIKRNNGNAYMVIFDRVEAPTKYEKRFIQHFHDDPHILPAVVGAMDQNIEVPGHIVNHNASGVTRVTVSNPDETYRLHTWNVLPEAKNVRIVGGRGTKGQCNMDGYDFFMEGDISSNARMDWWLDDSDCIEGEPQEVISYYTQFANVSPDNWGTWRSEVKAQSESPRAYFLTVLYSAGPSDTVPVVARSGDNGVTITDPNGSAVITFNKTGNLGGRIVLQEVGKAVVDETVDIEWEPMPSSSELPQPGGEPLPVYDIKPRIDELIITTSP